MALRRLRGVNDGVTPARPAARPVTETVVQAPPAEPPPARQPATAPQAGPGDDAATEIPVRELPRRGRLELDRPDDGPYEAYQVYDLFDMVSPAETDRVYGTYEPIDTRPRVRVYGCCLPIALAILLVVLTVAAALFGGCWGGAVGRGLTPTQGRSCPAAANPGGLRLGELAGSSGSPPPTTSDSVAPWPAGLVTNARWPVTAEPVVVRLTPTGPEAAAAPPGPTSAGGVRRAVGRGAGRLLRGLGHHDPHLQLKGRIPWPGCACPGSSSALRALRPGHPHHCAFVDAPCGDGELRLDC